MLQSNNEFRIHKNTNTKDRTAKSIVFIWCWKLKARGYCSFVTCYWLIWTRSKCFMKNNEFSAYFYFFFYATDLLHSVMRIWCFTARNYFWTNWNICMKLLLFLDLEQRNGYENKTNFEKTNRFVSHFTLSESCEW